MSRFNFENVGKLYRRRGALGKAFLVWLGSGSVLAAVIAYFVFSSMGC